MKKNYAFLCIFTMLLCAAWTKMNAQALSGVYTIDGGTPTGGTNFQTFTDFANALNTNGVSGPVTANVTNMTYNEQVTFNQITGMSAANRVVINGNGATLTFNSASSAAPHTFRLNGTDYMMVNELNIFGTGTTYALVCILTNNANFNSFNGCTFVAPVNGISSLQVPFAISGSGTSPTTAGGGEYNTVSTCTMANGYYGICAYGMTSSPWTKGNSFIGCRITDFYYYGMYFPYTHSMTIKNCTWDRMTRTAASAIYGWYGYYSQGGMFDGNIFHKFLENMQGQSIGTYIIYNYGQPVANGPRNTYRNNIITDMKSNTTMYGFYTYNSNSDHYNNTIDFDYAGATGANTIYGFYSYGSSGYNNTITNNIITIRRGASGSSRYPLYIAVAGNIVVDRNVIHTVAGSGVNYVGYYNGAHQTQAAWQGAGMDLTGFVTDPMYASLNDLHPTNAAINNTAIPMGLLFDQEMAVRHPSTPDVGALEFMTPNCTGQPSMTVAGPAFSLCPGETANLSIGNLSSDLGYTYSWHTSNISQVGPFTQITPAGPTNINFSVPNVTATTWVSAIVTCTAPGGSSLQAVAQINVAGPTSSTVPYYEDFEGIGLNDRLPNCSWLCPNIGGSAKTYNGAMPGNLLPNSGNSFASFNVSSSGANYYYTNSIWMDAGITYSASLWYMTDFSGSTNWSDLSILYGPAQSATGLTQIASTGPAVSPFYKTMGNTFTVPTSGMYYVAVRGTSSGQGAPNLAWDDLRIDIPCTPLYNTPVITANANNPSICSGQPVVLTANGGHAYSWSSGASGPSTTENPVVTTNYMVTGTNTLTGCSSTAAVNVQVKQSPVISTFAYPSSVCAGKATNLQASGAVQYQWHTGATGANVNVIPASSMNYSVIGTGTNGCSSTQAVSVTVLSNPLVSAQAINQDVCAGDAINMSGLGALTYQWVSTNPAMVLTGQSVNITLNTSVTFTVTGTDAKGCSGTAQLAMNVSECTGLQKLASANGLQVFPNPTSGKFTVAFDADEANVIVNDVTGRTLYTATAGRQVDIDLSQFASGIYYVAITIDGTTAAVKVVKE